MVRKLSGGPENSGNAVLTLLKVVYILQEAIG